MGRRAVEEKPECDEAVYQEHADGIARDKSKGGVLHVARKWTGKRGVFVVVPFIGESYETFGALTPVSARRVAEWLGGD